MNITETGSQKLGISDDEEYEGGSDDEGEQSE